MAKVTSKLQVTIPKRIAERCAISPGDEIEFVVSGDGLRVVLGKAEKLRLFKAATARQRARERTLPLRSRASGGRGWTQRICTPVARLVDTNVLVYRFDPRNAEKQRIALRLLEDGIASQSLVVPHQAIVELVAALTRPQQDLGSSIPSPR
jgi:AbrB family looped-hinge helix DNA binding protein